MVWNRVKNAEVGRWNANLFFKAWRGVKSSTNNHIVLFKTSFVKMQRNPSLERRLSIMDEGMDFDIPSYLTFDSCEAEAGFSFQMSPPRSARSNFLTDLFFNFFNYGIWLLLEIKKMGNTTGNEEISNVTMGSLQENAQKGSSKSSKTISGEQYRNSRDNMKKKQRNGIVWEYFFKCTFQPRQFH